jgi:predicted outer membrane repeat protein
MIRNERQVGRLLSFLIIAMIGLASYASQRTESQTPVAQAAASRIWCVRTTGGATRGPCANGTAFSTIQAAIDQKETRSGDEIRIAAGTYSGNSAQGRLPVVLINAKSLLLSGGYQNNDWTRNGPASATIIDGQNVRSNIVTQGTIELVILNLTVANGNAAITPAASVSGGGGIIAGDLNSVLYLGNAIITNNQASSDGGGVYSNGLVIIRNTKFIGNSAESRGGGVYSRLADIIGGTFEHNTSARAGGGLSVSDLSVSDSLFDHNTARGSDGGGAYVETNAKVVRTSFIGNTAGGSGAGLYQGFAATAHVDITSAIFQNNTAGNYGGGLAVRSAAAITATQFISNSANLGGGGLIQNSSAPPKRIIDSRFERNTTSGEGGGILFGGNGMVANSQFIANTAAKNGGAVALNNGAFGDAPAYQLQILGSTITGNQAAESGGGIFIKWSAQLQLNGTLVADNTAGQNGGGLSEQYDIGVPLPALTLNGGIFERNTAQQSGGGIFAQGNLTFTAAQIVSNTAALNGGGINTAGETTQLTGVLLANNRAQGAADALYVDDLGNAFPSENGQINLVNTTIASTAVAPHAAIQVQGTQANLMLTNTVVTSHTVGIARAAGSVMSGSYNDLFGNLADQTVGGAAVAPGFAQSLSVDPRFARSTQQDFHLSKDSSLIDAGDPTRNYSGQHDMDNQAVPASGRAEIGADEFYNVAYYLAELS